MTKVYVRHNFKDTTSVSDANRSETARIQRNGYSFVCSGCLNLSASSVSLLRVGFNLDVECTFHFWFLLFIFRVTKVNTSDIFPPSTSMRLLMLL